MKIASMCLLSLTLIFVACGPNGMFEDSSARATRETNERQIRETISVVETQVATMDALQALANNAGIMGTQIAQLNAQNQSLQATITNLETGVIRQNALPQPPAADPSGTFSAVDARPAPTNHSGGGVNYKKVSTAQSVRDDDGCAQQDMTEFPQDEDEIYIVVEAENVAPGMAFYSRWANPQGKSFETVEWVSEVNFEAICIWFYITPQDIPFVGGTWTAQLFTNGSTAASARFTVLGQMTPTTESIDEEMTNEENS